MPKRKRYAFIDTPIEEMQLRSMCIAQGRKKAQDDLAAGEVCPENQDVTEWAQSRVETEGNVLVKMVDGSYGELWGRTYEIYQEGFLFGYLSQLKLETMFAAYVDPGLTLFVFHDPVSQTFGYQLFHNENSGGRVGHFDDEVSGFDTIQDATSAGLKLIAENYPPTFTQGEEIDSTDNADTD